MMMQQELLVTGNTSTSTGSSTVLVLVPVLGSSLV
jgi:hypothetical protein